MGLEMAEELMEDVECSKDSYHATHQYPVVYIYRVTDRHHTRISSRPQQQNKVLGQYALCPIPIQ